MDKIEEAIRAKIGEDGKLSCKDAFDVANELGISPAAVGKETDRLKIKIKGCQLGCF